MREIDVEGGVVARVALPPTATPELPGLEEKEGEETLLVVEDSLLLLLPEPLFEAAPATPAFHFPALRLLYIDNLEEPPQYSQLFAMQVKSHKFPVVERTLPALGALPQ